MKIYLVFDYHQAEGNDFMGAFSTKEKAEQAIKDWRENHSGFKGTNLGTLERTIDQPLD